MSSYDVIILGGGPGGISALLWCNSLGLRAALLEREAQLGGQMLQMFHPVIDYPGLLPADGKALRDRFTAQLEQLKLTYRTGCEVEAVKLAARRVRVQGEWLEACALILATGARQRRLDIPGAAQFAWYEDPHGQVTYAGQPACVIGGGDSAIENSLVLAQACPSVTVFHRSASFRARPEWLEAARATPNITLLPQHEPLEIRGTDRVQSVRYRHTPTGVEQEMTVGAVFVRIGIEPNTELFRDQLEVNKAGYVRVDARQQSSLARVYAVGDVCDPVCRSVATAVGHGAIAAKAVAQALRTTD